MEIWLYAMCWNEELMLPFFLDHYGAFCSRIFMYDNGSTDRTLEILKAHPKVEVRKFDTGSQIRDDLKRQFANNVWKEARWAKWDGAVDYVIVCDVDEFLYHPSILEFLTAKRNEGFSVLEPMGINVVGDARPVPGKPLLEQYTQGVRHTRYSKRCVFNPNTIQEIGFTIGCHRAFPLAQKVQLFRSPGDLRLLHFRYLNPDLLAERYAEYGNRVSKLNVEKGWATGYLEEREKTLQSYQLFKKRALPLAAPLNEIEPEGMKSGTVAVKRSFHTEWRDATRMFVYRYSTSTPSSMLSSLHNSFTTEDQFVISTATTLATVDGYKRQVTPLLPLPAAHAIVGRTTKQVFHIKDSALWAFDLNSKTGREIAKLPDGWVISLGAELKDDDSLLALNATETEIAGAAILTGPAARSKTSAPLAMVLFRVDIASGKFSVIIEENCLVNHLQFSRTDPGLLLYSRLLPDRNEQFVLIRSDGTKRTALGSVTAGEITHHPVFSWDGTTVWHTAERPAEQRLFLAGYRIADGSEIRHQLPIALHSERFIPSPDGTSFAAANGIPYHPMAVNDGRWLYRVLPEGPTAKIDYLVHLQYHDASFQTRPTFSPDGKRLYFRGSMDGVLHVYGIAMTAENGD